MKKIIILLVVLLCLCGFTPPNHTGYVTDASQKLTQSQLDSLNQKLKNYEEKTHNQVAILLLNSLDGATIEDASFQTASAWKVGKSGVDNGLLLTLAIKERKTRIEVGKGLEGELTDIESFEILNNMRPNLRVENYFAALDGAINEITQKLEPRPAAKPFFTPDMITGSYLLFLLAGIPFLVIMILEYLAKRDKAIKDRDDLDSYLASKVSNTKTVSTNGQATTKHVTPVYVPPISVTETPRYTSSTYISSPIYTNSSSSTDYSSSSSTDYNSSSNGGGFSGGGGDFGGGGASSDW